MCKSILNTLFSLASLMLYGALLGLATISTSCTSDTQKNSHTKDEGPKHTAPTPVRMIQPSAPIDYDTSQWTEITSTSGIVLDMRYATTNNFTKEQIYPCERCFLRPAIARRILKLQADIHRRYGLSLKLYDCYRPRPAQQKLWDIVPDARYVTPPHRGSMHNRGLAIDVTLVDSKGQELDMGTPYDFFGPEAYTTNTSLPADILKNRKTLAKMMEIHGIKGIRTEWWHYSLKSEKAALADWQWPCE